MKKTLFIVLTLSLFSSCAKKPDPAAECQALTKSFESAERGYFIGCMKACFRATLAHAKDVQDKENFKDSCEIVCRDTIPYNEINHFKEVLQNSHGCQFDLSKKLANPPKKDAIAE